MMSPKLIIVILLGIFGSLNAFSGVSRSFISSEVQRGDRVIRDGRTNFLRSLEHSRYSSTQASFRASSGLPRQHNFFLHSTAPIEVDRVNGDDSAYGEIKEADIVICGGGPAGLLSAIMLAQKYPFSRKIKLFDRLAEPSEPDDETVWNDIAKFYLIGLGGRGQSALQEFGVWEEVERRCVPVLGRKDWSPEDPEPVERIFGKDKKVTTQVLPRDKLVSVLYKYIKDNYSEHIELYHGYEVMPVDFHYRNDTSVLLQIAKCNPTTIEAYKNQRFTDSDLQCDVSSASYYAARFLIAADGTVRNIANAMEMEDAKKYSEMSFLEKLRSDPPFKVTRYPDDNKRIYKTIPFKVPEGWRPDLNYSARTKGAQINFDALPANKKGDYCGVLLLKEGDTLARGATPPVELRKRMDEALPQFSALIDDETLARVAQKPVSQLPTFRYVSPRVHQGNCCVILGDCIHTVKPYFGLGANSALEDVKILSESLDATNHVTAKAVREFSERRALDAKILVRVSRDLDRPGKLGFITFILPLILDGIFSGIAPFIFNPNVITMLQREDLTFQQVASMKRRDRLFQVTLILGVLFGIVNGAKFLLFKVADVVGSSTPIVGSGLLASTAVVVAISKLSEKTNNAAGESVNDVKVESSQQTFIKPISFKKR